MNHSQSPEFRGYLPDEKPRFILSRRHELSTDETEERIAKIQEAYDFGLIKHLSPRQLQALVVLYPEDLMLPRKADAARTLGISQNALGAMDVRIMRTINRLLENYHQTPEL